MKDLTLPLSVFQSRGEGREEGGTYLRTVLHEVRERRISPPLQILLHTRQHRAFSRLCSIRTHLDRIQRLWVLDELVVVRELPLWQEVVERFGNVAVSVEVSRIY